MPEENRLLPQRQRHIWKGRDGAPAKQQALPVNWEGLKGFTVFV